MWYFRGSGFKVRGTSGKFFGFCHLFSLYVDNFLELSGFQNMFPGKTLEYFRFKNSPNYLYNSCFI